MLFKSVPHDGFDADPAKAAGGREPPDAEPPPDEELDIVDLVDEGSAAPAVDSVSLITQSLGATVVEELPRD